MQILFDILNALEKAKITSTSPLEFEVKLTNLRNFSIKRGGITLPSFYNALQVFMTMIDGKNIIANATATLLLSNGTTPTYTISSRKTINEYSKTFVVRGEIVSSDNLEKIKNFLLLTNEQQKTKIKAAAAIRNNYIKEKKAISKSARSQKRHRDDVLLSKSDKPKVACTSPLRSFSHFPQQKKLSIPPKSASERLLDALTLLSKKEYSFSPTIQKMMTSMNKPNEHTITILRDTINALLNIESLEQDKNFPIKTKENKIAKLIEDLMLEEELVVDDGNNQQEVFLRSLQDIQNLCHLTDLEKEIKEKIAYQSQERQLQACMK